MKWPIEHDLLIAASAHALAEYPKEACGIVTDDSYIPMVNVHETPERAFKISSKTLDGYYQSGKLRAILHSHPLGEAFPSMEDMASQEACAVPFGIMVMDGPRNVKEIFFFGDQVPQRRPYEGRVFRHGVDDCYALVRDFYKREGNIILPYFPRSHMWWETSANILVDNFASMGFKEIEFKQMRRGDCVLMHVHSKGKINHCGVYLGNSELLHHLWGSDKRQRLSKIENIHVWRNYISHCLRYGNGFPSK